MKITTKRPMAFLASAFAIAPLCAGLAADTNSEPSNTQATPAPMISSPAVTAPIKLPYGIEDVLKLSRAQIGEDVILNYVQSSGTIYNLTPKEIVYLKEQGVSEKVISAMLDQRKRVEMAQQAPMPVPPVAPNTPDSTATPAPNGAPGVPVYADQNATYAQAPLTPPASSVYVIPYSAGYPYYAPYYYPYYGWYGPSVYFGYGGHGYYGGHGHGYYGGHGYGGHAYGGHGGGGHGGH